MHLYRVSPLQGTLPYRGQHTLEPPKVVPSQSASDPEVGFHLSLEHIVPSAHVNGCEVGHRWPKRWFTIALLKAALQLLALSVN